jgi:hypothetical protein
VSAQREWAGAERGGWPAGESGPGNEASRIEQVVRFLAGLSGIVAAKAVQRSLLEKVREEESCYERSAFLPLVNAGVQEMLAREAVVAVVKNHHFREPPGPTVYLVERLDENLPERPPGGQPGRPTPGAPALEAGQANPDHCLEVGGQRYRVLGEEVLECRQPYAEKTLFLADSFVLFPNRRANPRTPSFFLMPPLGFRELEERQVELGVRCVISISPSSLSDRLLREACGFPPETSLATLLVGFDWAGPRSERGSDPASGPGSPAI